jgi:phage shock protein A
MLKKLDKTIKANLHGMVDKALEANKTAVLDEYIRQVDDVIAEAKKKIEQKQLEQERIGQFLERKKQLEDLLNIDPSNQKVKETLEQVNKILAEFINNPTD